MKPLPRAPLAVLFVLAVAGCTQPEPTPACKTFVACAAAYAAASQTTAIATADYTPGGVCWQSAENAALCDQECTEALAAYRAAIDAAHLDVAACATSAAPP